MLNPGNSLKAPGRFKLYFVLSGIQIGGLGLDMLQSCPVLRTHFSVCLVPHHRAFQSCSSSDFFTYTLTYFSMLVESN